MRRHFRYGYIVMLILTMLLSGAGAGIALAQEGDMVDTVARPEGTLPGDPQIELVKVAGGLADPVNVAAAPDGSGRLFIVERTGTIRILQDGEMLDDPFLDISGAVKTDFLEQGLLGLAFHPDYAENGRLFIYYIDWNTNGDAYLVEYHVSADDPNKVDPESAKVLFTHDEPYVNHNGGTVHFGPDGYLYWSMGDGGLAGDPHDNAQNLSTILGSILRIDVDDRGANAYGIPDTNPFAQGVVFGRPEDAATYHPDATPEIWAYGLRNPWQFSFDPANGDLYIADVGQNFWEEVNYQPAISEGGVNYGWDFLEASHCYPAGSQGCPTVGTLPVAEFNHDDGRCSITGGAVYRGESASLDGIYFNSDYCSGQIFGLIQTGDGWAYAELMDTDLQVTGSGTDTDGNVYFTSCDCTYGRDYDPLANPRGAVWQVMAADMVPEGAETAGMNSSGEAERDRADHTPAGDETPRVRVSNQAMMDGKVVVDEVVSHGAGWIVIHANENDSPGPVIGHAAVEDGVNQDVTVEIDAEAATETLFAMLHTDTGEMGTYEFPGADTPVQVDGELVTPAFTLTDLPTVETSMEAPPNQVQVSLLEWAINMPAEIPAGETVFVISNDGGFAHNFAIENESMGVESVFDQNLEPGDVREMTIDLAPAEYRVYCPVGNHAAEGMDMILTVTE